MRHRHRHAPAKPNQRHLPLKPSSLGYSGGVTVRQRATSAAATTLVKGWSCVACPLSEKAFAETSLQRHPMMSLGAGGKEWRLRGVLPGMLAAEVKCQQKVPRVGPWLVRPWPHELHLAELELVPWVAGRHSLYL